LRKGTLENCDCELKALQRERFTHKEETVILKKSEEKDELARQKKKKSQGIGIGKKKRDAS